MSPNRSKPAPRSTTSRRALAILILSAVVSSSVLAAPTARPRALMSIESIPTSTRSSDGPESLNRAGDNWEYTTTLRRHGEVDHSDVVLRQVNFERVSQDADDLQMFDPEYDEKTSLGSALDLEVSTDLEQQRATLSKRGCCSSRPDEDSSGPVGAANTSGPVGAANTSGPVGAANTSGGGEGGELVVIKPLAERQEEHRQKLRQNANWFPSIESRIFATLRLEGGRLKEECKYIKKNYAGQIQGMADTATAANNDEIDVEAHGGVSLRRYQILPLLLQKVCPK
ncbi:hypothetical protein FB446DRAFT_759330 [Lentinula raphanica]|nr:hypothetical protein FB446DRAFT_759330 [Lentinula raphanica]